MVYAQDLKSCEDKTSCGFESHPRHKCMNDILQSDEIASPTQDLETNIPFAYEIAHTLNDLIDDGVLTSKDISSAKSSHFDEFLMRYMVKGRLESIDEEEAVKIQSIFRSENIQQTKIDIPRE